MKRFKMRGARMMSVALIPALMLATCDPAPKGTFVSEWPLGYAANSTTRCNGLIVSASLRSTWEVPCARTTLRYIVGECVWASRTELKDAASAPC